jgi:nitrogen fixation/metabolism regulation signal transduction histidine kinase
MELFEVIIAIVIASFAGPTVLRWLDKKRQEAIADSVIVASNAVVESSTRAEKASKELLEVTRHSASTLGIIHTLVNSNLTAAVQAELASTERELVLLRLIKPPDEEAKAIAESRISELKSQLKDREGQQDVAQVQMDVEKIRQE